MVLHNMMNCAGFDKSFLAGCSMAWLGLVIIFFIAALLRKWGGEEVDIPFNFISSIVAGFLAYIIIITFTGSSRWSVLAGIIGVLVAGYVTPYFYEEGFIGGGN